MPQAPRLWCADCGAVMHQSKGSLPQGQARCNPCRAKAPGRTMTASECQYCRQQFPHEVGKVRKYCGIKCSNLQKNLARAVVDGRGSQRVCEACGQTFTPNHAKGQQYCTRACASPPRSSVRWWRCPAGRHAFTENSGRRCLCKREVRVSTMVRTCCECDHDYVREPLDGKSTRCPACRAAHNREQVRLAKDRRRARKRDAYVADVYRARIYARDQYRCKLCGKKLRMNAVVPHPLAPVLDHITPLALGGKHEPANVQAAHFLCNSQKSWTGYGDQLLLIG